MCVQSKETALHTAAKFDRFEVAEVLINSGAEQLKDEVGEYNYTEVDLVALLHSMPDT